MTFFNTRRQDMKSRSCIDFTRKYDGGDLDLKINAGRDSCDIFEALFN